MDVLIVVLLLLLHKVLTNPEALRVHCDGWTTMDVLIVVLFLLLIEVLSNPGALWGCTVW